MDTLATTPAPSGSQLVVRNLSKKFPVKLDGFKTGYVSAVDAVSFEVAAGKTLGIVGESGCGKSTAARLVLQLIKPDEGEVLFEGQDIRHLKGDQKKAMRRSMQMVFQDPYSSVNPRMSIGENVGFPMKVNGYSKKEIRERTAMLLEQVGLHRNRASYFPFQLSGGQLQRVNIARALALDPKLIICDEAVAALDKSIQAQVLNLLKDLQAQMKLTYLFISHDLNVVEYMSDYVLVMYMGQVVEACSSEDLYKNPLHPYTKILLNSIPKIGAKSRQANKLMSGDIPSPLNPPSGCRFRTRCPMAMAICDEKQPVFTQPEKNHAVACYLYESGIGPTPSITTMPS
jgi:oligopeptide/dipeptide ABC transporter ATP-binding protein